LGQATKKQEIPMALDPRPAGRSRSTPLIIGAVVAVAVLAVYFFVFAGATVDNRADPPAAQTETPSGSTPGTTPPAGQ
jgi:hypothetical protein